MEHGDILVRNEMYYVNRMADISDNGCAGMTEDHTFENMDLTVGAVDGNIIYMFIVREGIDPKKHKAFQKCEIRCLLEDQCMSGDRVLRREGLENIIAFYSPAGGVGCTSAAIACARYFAARQKKTLYLNLEKSGGAGLYFDGQGWEKRHDVFYGLNGEKSAMGAELGSLVRRDASGVYFFDSAGSVFDNCEAAGTDIEGLLRELKSSGNYQMIVIDFNFNFEERDWAILANSGRYIMVTDGRTESNKKCEKACHAILRKTGGESIDRSIQRMWIFYNRFDSKNGEKLMCPSMEELGGMPKIEVSDYKMIIAKMSRNNSFGKLL